MRTLGTVALAGLFLLVLVAGAAAETLTPEVFISKTTEWLEQDDLAKLAMGVRFQAEVAEKAFQQVLQVHQAAPSEPTERWLNAVARAFRLEGDGGPNGQLEAIGALWPETRWRGTMFEADQVVDTRGTVAEMLPAAAPQKAEAFGQALAATHLAVRVGNDQALPSMLEALKAYLKAHPDDPRRDEVMALEVSALEATGLWSEALELGETYAAQCAEPLPLRLAMLAAARKLERPQEVDRLLALSRTLLAADENALARFIVDSIAFERRCQSEEVSLAELTRRHVEVWRWLREPELAGIPGGLGRQTVEAAGIWVGEGLRRLFQETEEFPNKAQLSYVVWEDLRRLKGLAKSQMAMQFQPSEASTFLRLWNPEFMLATQALELEVVAAFRRQGDKEQARRLLAEAGPGVQETWETIKEAGLGYQLAHYGNPIQLHGGQFEFVWTLGEAPRMVALQRIERAYLYDDANALEEALVYQQDARSKGGFLGLEDARFLKVERLLGSSKTEAAAALNTELQKLSTNSGYRPGQIVCIINSAELELKAGHKPKALELARRAVGLVEEYLVEAGGQGGALRSRFRRAYELLAELQLEAGLGEEAFATLGRLGQAQSLMSLDVDRLAASDPKLAAMKQKLETTRSRARALEEAKAHQATAGRKPDKVEGEIAGNRSEFYQALGEIRRQYPDYGQMLAVRPVNFARLQEHVPKDTVIVQIFPARDALFLFLLTHDGLKIHKVAVGQDKLSELADSARKGLLRSRERGLQRAGRALMTAKDAASPESAELSLSAFVELYGYLVEPIAKEIEPYPVIAFIPSGALMDIPLQALARKQGQSLEFLIERKQVVTILKSSDLERLDSQPASARGAMMVVGNPDGTLPGAADEARAIAALVPNSEMLLGEQATLAKVKGLSGKSSLHLATHGILNHDDPNQSYLVLGKGDQLNISEIAGLNLAGLRLVTLSACETALGVDSQGQSELTTLADAFSFAGCPTVAASLWKVSDESTKVLMEKFYQELQAGATPSAALQSAQKALLADKATQHPYYWAPFLLIGDWR